MRLAWAIVLGAVGAGVLAWWLARTPDPPDPNPRDGVAGTRSERPAGPTLYRWRDDAGVVQVTDRPPSDRSYSVVDSAALERRNTIHPNPGIAAETE